MPLPSFLPPLLLCIFILLPIISSQQQQQQQQQQQSPSNAGTNQSTATANQTSPLISSGNGTNQSTATANQTSPLPPPPSPPTPPSRRSKPFFAREFLLAHNRVRLNVTHPLLNWDKKLARYARRWGMKRMADCRMVHSYGPYGENLFWGALDHWTPTEAVDSWTREKQFYDAQHNACDDGQMCGHYTQIIWKDSVKLGCTRVNCQTGGVLMICEYDPPGNYVNESPFGSVNDGAGTGTGATATTTAGPKTTGTVSSPPSNASTGSSANQKIGG